MPCYTCHITHTAHSSTPPHNKLGPRHTYATQHTEDILHIQCNLHCTTWMMHNTRAIEHSQCHTPCTMQHTVAQHMTATPHANIGHTYETTHIQQTTQPTTGTTLSTHTMKQSQCHISCMMQDTASQQPHYTHTTHDTHMMLHTYNTLCSPPQEQHAAYMPQNTRGITYLT